MPKILSEEFKNELREFYKSKPMGFDVLVEKYKISPPTIIKILGDAPRWPKHLLFSPEMDEDYFSVIDNERKAYFIGLIISDGNVFVSSGGRSKSTSITLSGEDKYILEEFKKDLKVNTAVANDGRGCNYVAVRSDKIADDLAKYGIVPRKSLKTYLPTNIDEKYMRHLIRGIMDGDGNIRMNETKRRYIHSVSFTGTHRLMSDISDYISEKLSFKKRPKVYDYEDRHLSEIKIQNIEDINKLLSWLYKDATIYLTRKRKSLTSS